MKVNCLIIISMLVSNISLGQSKVLYKNVGDLIMEKSIFSGNEYKYQCYSENSNSIILKAVDEKLETGEYLLKPVIKFIDTTILYPNNLSFTIELSYIKYLNGKSTVVTVPLTISCYWGVKIIGRNKPGDTEEALYGEWGDRRVKLTWTKNDDNTYDYLLIDDAPQLYGGLTIIFMPNMKRFKIR